MKRFSPPSIALLAAILGIPGISGCRSAPDPQIKMIPPPRVELSPPPVTLPAPSIEVVSLPGPSHPNVAIRIAFRAGAADDPPGREGITALAAEVMAEGGTEKLTSAEIHRALYPMAAEIDAQTDEEMTVFAGRVHKDHLARFLPILVDAVAHPRWDPKEFERLREDALNDVERRLRTSDDENLGKAALQWLLYGRHPYGHYEGGSVAALKAVTLDELKAHAQKVFTRSRLIIGVAGGYPAGTEDQIQQILASLPIGDLPSARIPPAPPQNEPRVLLVEKEADSIAISMGHPYMLRRGDSDFPAMRLALSAFGEHRQFNGRLMDRLRSVRGLNYGDYAYVESFVQDGGTTYPEPNVPRTFQMFSIWVRPVEEKNALFALRAALYETQKLVTDGLSKEEVERTKKFLAGYSLLFTQTDARRLGFAMDDRFYKTPDYQKSMREGFTNATVEQVNSAIRKWIDPKQLHIVLVTRDAAKTKRELLSGAPTPIHYDVTVPKAVLDEDKRIESMPLGLKESDIEVVKAGELFEK